MGGEHPKRNRTLFRGPGSTESVWLARPYLYGEIQPKATLRALISGPMKPAKGPLARASRMGQTIDRMSAPTSICAIKFAGAPTGAVATSVASVVTSAVSRTEGVPVSRATTNAAPSNAASANSVTTRRAVPDRTSDGTWMGSRTWLLFFTVISNRPPDAPPGV